MTLYVCVATYHVTFTGTRHGDPGNEVLHCQGSLKSAIEVAYSITQNDRSTLNPNTYQNCCDRLDPFCTCSDLNSKCDQPCGNRFNDAAHPHYLLWSLLTSRSSRCFLLINSTNLINLFTIRWHLTSCIWPSRHLARLVGVVRRSSPRSQHPGLQLLQLHW